MKKTLWHAILLLVVVMFAGAMAASSKTAVNTGAQSGAAEKIASHVVLRPSDIKWENAPPGLPPGAQMAHLEGDSSKPGYFAVRMKAPDGYKIMPHWHPNVERITVISGTLHIGMGDTFDESKGEEMPPGTYATMPAKMHHYAWTTGETVIQLNTLGPWKIVYLNPADDPSKTQK